MKADLLVFSQRMLHLGRTLSRMMYHRTGSLEQSRTGSVGGRTLGRRSTFRLRVQALVDCSVSIRSLMSSKLGIEGSETSDPSKMKEKWRKK